MPSFILAFFLLVFGGVVSAAPQNICNVIAAHPKWYKAARTAEEKWGIPVHVQFAIIHRESNFNPTAKNHSSSAYGFAQALNATWREYEKEVGSKLQRDNFFHASDFIGWYGDQANKSLGISTNNAHDLYLAYHDGTGGFHKAKRNAHSTTSKLARGVALDARRYHAQLAACRPYGLSPEQHYKAWIHHPYTIAIRKYTKT